MKIRPGHLKVSETILEGLIIAHIWSTDCLSLMSIVRIPTVVMPKCKPYRNIPYKPKVIKQIDLGLGRHHSVWDCLWFSF